MEFSKKLQQLPTQFFAALVQKVNAALAEGRDVNNLGQGNPDQPTPPHIIQALQKAATILKIINTLHFVVSQNYVKQQLTSTNVNTMWILILRQKYTLGQDDEEILKSLHVTDESNKQLKEAKAIHSK